VHVVTGGAGFIGVNLADALLRDGEQVVVLDNFSRIGTRDNIRWLQERHADVEVVEADIRASQDQLEGAVAKADAVHHFAGQVAVTASLADPRTDFEINALGTLNVLEAVRKSNPDAIVVFASTNKVYGGLEALPVVEQESRYGFGEGLAGVSEEQPLDFHSPYACSKGAGDQYVRDYARVFGLRTVVLRQSCIYGPRQFGVEDQGWLAWFAIAALLRKPITIYGNGKQVRDVLHVDDLAGLIRRAVAEIDRTRGEVYNVGGGPSQSLSLLEALAVLEDELGTKIDVTFTEPRTGDQRIYVSDIGKAAAELGWEPAIGVPEGLKELTRWIAENIGTIEALHH
jgi:CDP-paratose 2-epimerase